MVKFPNLKLYDISVSFAATINFSSTIPQILEGNENIDLGFFRC